MKKSEIARQFDFKATSCLLSASVALTLNSLFNYIVNNFEINVVLNAVFAGLVAVFAIFADIMTIKGFLTVNKSCKLSEENQNYYFGRKLTVLTVALIVVGLILTFVAIFMSVLIAQYEQLEVLTAADEKARMNILILTTVVNILLQLAAISTPYIVYVWKLRSLISPKDKLSNMALFTVIIMIVQLAIGILNSTYIVKNSPSTFLTSFSEILLIVKYVVLSVFIFLRRKRLSVPIIDEE